VIFESADGSLGRIAAVDVWRDQLEIDVLLLQKIFECL
jgi:hypothetical protein